jgi:hypothetical protein
MTAPMSSRRAWRLTSVRPQETPATVVLLRDGNQVASWPVQLGEPVDLEVVDGLARLQLTAMQLGCTIRLCHVPQEVAELLDLVGLLGILTGGRLLAEVEGQPEHLEQTETGDLVEGDEEVVMPDDPVT